MGSVFLASLLGFFLSRIRQSTSGGFGPQQTRLSFSSPKRTQTFSVAPRTLRLMNVPQPQRLVSRLSDRNSRGYPTGIAWMRKSSICVTAKNTVRYHKTKRTTHDSRRATPTPNSTLISREMDRRSQNTGRVYFPRSKVTFLFL